MKSKRIYTIYTYAKYLHLKFFNFSSHEMIFAVPLAIARCVARNSLIPQTDTNTTKTSIEGICGILLHLLFHPPIRDVESLLWTNERGYFQKTLKLRDRKFKKNSVYQRAFNCVRAPPSRMEAASRCLSCSAQSLTQNTVRARAKILSPVSLVYFSECAVVIAFSSGGRVKVKQPWSEEGTQSRE